MYIIKYEHSMPQLNGELTASYFLRFDENGIREYGKKQDAMRFPTRVDALDFNEYVLGNRAGHSVIKIAD